MKFILEGFPAIVIGILTGQSLAFIFMGQFPSAIILLICLTVFAIYLHENTKLVNMLLELATTLSREVTIANGRTRDVLRSLRNKAD